MIPLNAFIEQVQRSVKTLGARVYEFRAFRAPSAGVSHEVSRSGSPLGSPARTRVARCLLGLELLQLVRAEGLEPQKGYYPSSSLGSGLSADRYAVRTSLALTQFAGGGKYAVRTSLARSPS